jgi:hypothetical protein
VITTAFSSCHFAPGCWRHRVRLDLGVLAALAGDDGLRGQVA